MSTAGAELLSKLLPNIPELPGVYKMLDKDNKILYIGKAKSLKKRIVNYTSSNLSPRIHRMIFLVRNFEYIITNSEAEAFLLEANLIKNHQPTFNILLKDDKSFPYIKIDIEHDYPKIIKYRGKASENGLYYGPFASVYDVDLAITELQKIFLLRSCSDYYFATRIRPCLLYQIKRCSGPCVNKVSKESYLQLVTQAKKFLSGKFVELQEMLSVKMQQYSDDMEFEKAAVIRDRIKILTSLQMRSGNLNSNIKDADIIVTAQKNGYCCIQIFFYRAGQHYGHKAYFPINVENSEYDEIIGNFIGWFYQGHNPPESIIIEKQINNAAVLEDALFILYKTKIKIIEASTSHNSKLIENALQNTQIALDNKIQNYLKHEDSLLEIKSLFNLEKLPSRIEIYDNSHIMGQHGVGVMVVSTKEGFVKSEYRSYNITTEVFGGDDYFMLSQMLKRRLAKLTSLNTPDLLIIDGGKGHLSTAAKVISDMNLDIKFLCMSKGVDRNAGKEVFHVIDKEPFTLEKNTKVMKYLQILRDEAHNFAITTYRKKHLQSLKVSALDDILNIGQKRKMLLLKHFGSFESIKDASLEQIEKIAGIGKKIAQKIFESLHQTNQ